MPEINEQPKLTGIDRQLQILNGISVWVQGLSDSDRQGYFFGRIEIPENVFNKEDLTELVKIGTARQILDAALEGISISDPRESSFDI